MERKIGEVFDYNNDKLQVIESFNPLKCSECYFYNDGCMFSRFEIGECLPWNRSDKKNVIFKVINSRTMKEHNVKLTLEKAREWYNKGGELKEVALQAFKENELKDSRSHSWEEFCKNNITSITGYFIDGDSLIHKSYSNGILSSIYDKNIYPTEEYAEAALALCQLLQLRQEWIGDWEPDWKGNKHHCIVPRYDGPAIILYSNYPRILSFPTFELAVEFMNDFKDLLEIANPLL